LIPVILAFINFHPIIMAVTAFYFIMVFSWIIAPELYNPGVKYFSAFYEKNKYNKNVVLQAATAAIKVLDVVLFFFYCPRPRME